MKTTGYSKPFSLVFEHYCRVCSRSTPIKTIHLLKEYGISMRRCYFEENSVQCELVFPKELLGKDICA